jgi:hypothetical protein
MKVRKENKDSNHRFGIRQSEAIIIQYALGIVVLSQLVRFLVVELIPLDSNPRFSIDVAFMTNYFFNGRRRFGRQRYTLDDRLRESHA